MSFLLGHKLNLSLKADINDLGISIGENKNSNMRYADDTGLLKTILCQAEELTWRINENKTKNIRSPQFPHMCLSNYHQFLWFVRRAIKGIKNYLTYETRIINMLLELNITILFNNSLHLEVLIFKIKSAFFFQFHIELNRYNMTICMSIDVEMELGRKEWWM